VKYASELYGQVFAIAFVASVLGNMVAGVLLGLGPLIHLHRKLNRHHRELLSALGQPEKNGLDDA
jgi:hypothetical protein